MLPVVVLLAFNEFTWVSSAFVLPMPLTACRLAVPLVMMFAAPALPSVIPAPLAVIETDPVPALTGCDKAMSPALVVKTILPLVLLKPVAVCTPSVTEPILNALALL